MLDQTQQHRNFMKADWRPVETGATGRQAGRPRPPLAKPRDEGMPVLELPAVAPDVIVKANLYDCLRDRESRREFSGEALSAAELSFLLWATQGVKRVIGNSIVTLRPVPSAGARHPFETYLVINRVAGVRPGLYRYLPISHQLQELPTPAAIGEQMRTVSAGEEWPAAAAAVFLWSCVAERGEWAYGATAHKMMLLDAGHIAQNLYLACEAIGCGTCAYAGYSQTAADALIGLDGDNEFTVYMAPVGRPAR